MTISAKIIADSISPDAIRLTTMELKYPRFIHAEFMTHRVFSRNASSSRAIPVEKMIQAVLDDPAMPIYWGKNQPGMQAKVELEGDEKRAAMRAWLDGMNQAVQCAHRLIDLGVHKQIANRMIEPWSHITVVVTATEWSNFLHLRDHEDAQPEIAELARCVRAELVLGNPVLLQPGEWHVPYVTPKDVETICNYISNKVDTFDEYIKIARQVSAARCARVSYLTHDGKAPDIETDLALFERLVGSSPLHASPTEHQATPDGQYHVKGGGLEQWQNPALHGNLTGWVQHRKLLPGENVASR